VTHLDIPITPEKVWRILKEEGAAQQRGAFAANVVAVACAWGCRTGFELKFEGGLNGVFPIGAEST
jgi:hypothetical protein